MEYAFVCGGSAGELCLSCTAPIVIASSVIIKHAIQFQSGSRVSIRSSGSQVWFLWPVGAGTSSFPGYLMAQGLHAVGKKHYK